MQEYKIVVDPEGHNDDERNIGGMVVYLVKGSAPKHQWQEVSRVAFVRRESNNPKTKFKEQLRFEVDKARAACDLLNEQLVGSGGLA